MPSSLYLTTKFHPVDTTEHGVMVGPSGQEDLKETPGSPYSGTIPPRITSQGPSAVRNRTPYLMPTPSAGNVLVGLEPNRRPNYHKDIAPKTLPSIGPSSPEGPQVV
ncbi:unnamed protein product [Rhizophagus irregularis]|nr:unnamed protein product [Rhizophagus irregularis]